MKQYIVQEKCPTYKKKKDTVKELINHTLRILDTFGVPVNSTPRRIERMALAFLACGDIKSYDDFKITKDSNSDYSLKTREIITFVNEHFLVFFRCSKQLIKRKL